MRNFAAWIDRNLGKLFAIGGIAGISFIYYLNFKLDWGIIVAYSSSLFALGKARDDHWEIGFLIRKVSTLEERCRHHKIDISDI